MRGGTQPPPSGQLQKGFNKVGARLVCCSVVRFSVQSLMHTCLLVVPYAARLPGADKAWCITA